jgi:hypothetical protein
MKPVDLKYLNKTIRDLSYASLFGVYPSIKIINVKPQVRIKRFVCRANMTLVVFALIQLGILANTLYADEIWYG